ncbi:MAG: CRISPR-associated endonuclease Cas1 [bacterium]
MGTLYLTEQNAHLRKTSQRLVVEKDGEIVRELPSFKVERVVVFGNVQITTQALMFLLQQGIDTSLLSLHGQLYGRLVPAESKNIFLRLQQYRAYGDSSFRLTLSKELVRSKLTNGRRLLQRLSYGRDLDLAPWLEEIARHAKSVETAHSLASVRGYEGKGTATYFEGFGKLVKGFAFTGRTRRPPKDPVNSLLSFGYTLLAGEVFAALSAGGLDPYLGFFHEVHYGRAALCFDLCEEFRHLVVDSLVLDLINHQVLKPDDFTSEPETEGILLKPEARKLFLSNFEKKMTGIRKPGAGEEESFRLAIHHQVDELRKVLAGKTEYKGYRYG